MILRPYDDLIVDGRRAVFLFWMWRTRTYARIRFTDNNERRVVNVMDIERMT